MSKVSGDVLSYCTSCRMDLNHIVVAMSGDQIKKVECRTCKKTHNFRAPKGLDAPVKKTARKSSAKGAKAETRSVAEEWNLLMSKSKNNPTRPYSTKTTFQTGEKVSHPTFGEGVIEKTIHPNKIEVVFQSAIRVLIHQGEPRP